MARESVSFDRAAGYYDQTRGFPPGVEAQVATLIAHLGGLGAGSSVLEIGVGTGRIALPLAAHVSAVVGVDLSRPMMLRLHDKRADAPVYLAQADAARLPFPSGVFDGALGVHVFHLIPAWRDVLRELARVLRPGAALVSGGNTDALLARGEYPVVKNVGVAEEERDTFLQKEGWRPLGAAQEVGWVAPLRPADVLRGVTQRLNSSTWRMTDEQIDQYARALRRALSLRFGDLDRTYDLPRVFKARAFLPPG